jgi:hypothetical protein
MLGYANPIGPLRFADPAGLNTPQAVTDPAR